MKRLFILLIMLMLTLCSCNFITNPDNIGSTTNPDDNIVSDGFVEDDQYDDNNSQSGNQSNDDNQDDIPSNDDNQNNDDYNQDDDLSDDNQNNDDNNQDDNSSDDDNQNNDDNNQDDNTSDDDNNQEELVKQFLISTPNFETRRINSISEITMQDFFNLGNRVDIKVSISNTELKKLQSDYETGKKSEIYRLASKVVITLTNYNNKFKWEFENVGIRQKGNTSRQNIINGDGKINLNHYKLSFDETFDDPEMYDSSFISKNANQSYKDREFLGMSGLDFKWNKNYDQTHIREIYANYLYIASGVIAQHSGLSTFSLIETDKSNKETSMGLCTVYEPATKTLIKRSLKSDVEYVNMSDWSTEKNGTFGVAGENYGDLYKCIYGADLSLNSISGSNIGISNISGSYIPKYDRKTNKDAVYNDILLRNAVNAISTGNYAEISKYVDLEYLAISEAVGFVVGNPDSMRYNMNNFMIYMRRTDGKMIFIPIDSDRCFGITKDWNPKDGNMKLEMLDRKNSNNNNTIGLLLDTILAKTSNESQKLYVDFCNKIKESAWVSTSTFNKYFEMAKASYSDFSFSLTDSSNNYTFEKYITNKVKYIYPITDSGSDNNGSSSASKYNNLYIVGTFNNWGDYPSSDLSKYKMIEIAENVYSVTVSITSSAILNDNDGKGDYIKLKFNNGYKDYSQIDWTLSSDLKTLVMSKGSSARFYGAKAGDKMTVTINVATKSVSIVIN